MIATQANNAIPTSVRPPIAAVQPLWCIRYCSNPVTPKKTPLQQGVWCTRWGSSRARCGFPCARSTFALACALTLLVPTKRYQRFALRATRPTLDGDAISQLFKPCYTKKNALATGRLVYPLGFEPRLDGVGGRNVIQLHYEYVFRFHFRSQKEVFSKSNYILLFFTSILQAFML